MSNLNSCTHAIEFFEDGLKNGKYKENGILFEKYLRLFVDLMTDSQRFIISEDATVIIEGDNDYSKPITSVFQSPYPVISIESCQEDFIRSIYLVVEVLKGTKNGSLFPELAELGSGALVIPVIGTIYQRQHSWEMLSGGQFLTYANTDENFLSQIWSVEIIDTAQKDRLEVCKVEDSWGATRAFANLCKLLNCKNVEAISHPPSIALNKKRIKNGKLPFFEYKTLHIKTNQVVSGRSGSVIADRNSPRVHLRRGHIRMLPSGETTWVQSCVVGSSDKGFIKKDYKISC